MKKIAILPLLLAVCFVIAAQAQTAAAKPSPEMKMLHSLLGHWTYEGEYQATPVSTADKTTGEVTFQMVLGGFYLQSRWAEKGSAGELHAIEMDGYDPAAKSLAYTFYSDDGNTLSGTFAFNANTATTAAKYFFGGKEYMVRQTNTFAADWMTATWKGEISTDGKTWMPWYEVKMTKVKPAAKK